MTIWLHGGAAPVHDYHTGDPGSFESTLAHVDELRTGGRVVAVSTLMSRSSFRVLSDLPPLLDRHGVGSWRIVVPFAHDGLTFERLVPRLALALPFALHALSRASRLGISAWIDGAPLCLLGPYASRALPAERRSYGAPCAACAVRDRCPGVDPAYLERFGDAELRALDDAPEADEPPAMLRAQSSS